MTNSNSRIENHFDYVKIHARFSRADPAVGGNARFPNGQVVGEVHQARNDQLPQPSSPRWTGCFCEKIFRTFQRLGMPLRASTTGAAPGDCLRALRALRSPKAGCAGNRMGFIQAGGSGVPCLVSQGDPSYVAILLGTCRCGMWSRSFYFKLLCGA